MTAICKETLDKISSSVSVLIHLLPVYSGHITQIYMFGFAFRIYFETFAML